MRGPDVIFDKIMARNFAYLMKDTNQKNSRSVDLSQRKITAESLRTELLKANVEKDFKAATSKRNITFKKRA